MRRATTLPLRTRPLSAGRGRLACHCFCLSQPNDYNSSTPEVSLTFSARCRSTLPNRSFVSTRNSLSLMAPLLFLFCLVSASMHSANGGVVLTSPSSVAGSAFVAPETIWLADKLNVSGMSFISYDCGISEDGATVFAEEFRFHFQAEIFARKATENFQTRTLWCFLFTGRVSRAVVLRCTKSVFLKVSPHHSRIGPIVIYDRANITECETEALVPRCRAVMEGKLVFFSAFGKGVNAWSGLSYAIPKDPRHCHSLLMEHYFSYDECFYRAWTWGVIGVIYVNNVIPSTTQSHFSIIF